MMNKENLHFKTRGANLSLVDLALKNTAQKETTSSMWNNWLKINEQYKKPE